MANTNVLFTAMAERCSVLLTSAKVRAGFPDPLQPEHLLWMCGVIIARADTWSPSRINRWFGFIQAGILAHGLLDIDELKRMFDAAKNAHGTEIDDMSLLDHLDPKNSFEFEIGGEN